MKKPEEIADEIIHQTCEVDGIYMCDSVNLKKYIATAIRDVRAEDALISHNATCLAFGKYLVSQLRTHSPNIKMPERRVIEAHLGPGDYLRNRNEGYNDALDDVERMNK